MMLPPALLRVRVQNEERRFRLWLPVVVLWPLVAAIALVATPIVALAGALSWRGGRGRSILMAWPLLLYLLASLRGLRVDVASGAGRVFFSFD